MKISIITFQAVSNHGSVLQTFATQKIFENFGLKVEIINFKKEECRGIFPLIKFWTKDNSFLFSIIKGILLYPSFFRWERLFKRFLYKYINVNLDGPVYSYDEDFFKMKIDSDIYCSGSDQVWNSTWNGGIIKPLFLNFVPDNIKKIAFSSSFGKDKLLFSEIKETKKLLSRYDFISVRERSGLSILNNLGIENCIQLLDPTLLCDSSFWDQYTPKRIVKEKYLLIYQLYSDRQFDHYAKKLAKRNNLKLIRFCTRYDQLFKSGKGILAPKILDFLSLIKYSSCVLTDSFHGTAFSVNFSVNFISFIPKFGGRIYSLLKEIQLENRIITNFDDLSVADEKIDFNYANYILKKERIKADNFVRQVIKEK